MSRPRPASRRLFSKDELDNSPSVRGGLERAAEAKYRYNNCQLIRDCAKDLKLPWFVVETAIIFAHRYFAVRSYFKNDKFVIATACLFLATKVDNSPRSINDVVRTCLSWRCHASKRPDIRAQLHNQVYYENLRESVLIAESAVLCALSYDMAVDHPFNAITRITKQLFGEDVASNVEGRKLLQFAQNICNDSEATTLGLQFTAEHIGAAAVYVSSKLRKAPLPWAGGLSGFSERFGVPQATLDDIESQMMDLYNRTADVKAAPPAAVAAPLLPPLPRMLPSAPVGETRASAFSGGADGGGEYSTTGGVSTSTREHTITGCAATAAGRAAAEASCGATERDQGASVSKALAVASGTAAFGGTAVADVVLPAALTPDGGGDVRRPPSPVPSASPFRKRPFAAAMAGPTGGPKLEAVGCGAEVGAAVKRARMQVV